AAAVLGLPALLTAGVFLRHDNTATFTSGSELGNLIRPLDPLQVFGIWPSGDCRVDPGHGVVAYGLIGVAIGAAATGAVLAGFARAWGLLVYAAAAAAGCALLAGAGSPWVAGKAFATAAPAFALLAA